MSGTVNASILEKLQAIFQEQFFDDRLIITEDTSPEQVEEWDSLAHINLLASIEKAFGIRFTSEEMGDIDSVREIVKSIVRKRGA